MLFDSNTLRTNNLISQKAFIKIRGIAALRLEFDVMKDEFDTFKTEFNATKLKLDQIIALFSIVFKADGTIDAENYTTHKHNYTDATIADTADGTGTLTETTKTTTVKV